MRIRSWLKNWPRRHKLSAVSSIIVPAQTELLETRSLLSGSALVIGAELNITLTTNENVRVSAIGGNVVVETSVGSGFLMPLANFGSVPANSIQSIIVTGGDEENTIDLSLVAAADYTSLASIKVNAGNGDDSILGSTDFADSLIGGDGNDTLDGQGGDDTLDGGNGNDVVRGGTGNDSVLAGDGNDNVQAGIGNDTVLAGNGQDTVDLGDGNDSVSGENGEDVLSGGLGNDTLNGDGGNDTVNGNDGNDSILGGEFADSLLGGDGNDTIDGQAGADIVDGQLGDDSLIGSSGNDSLNGGDGNDFVNGSGGNDSVFGNLGTDALLGGSGNDVLDGQEGNDTILGQGGDDSMFGGSGADRIVGGDGNDLGVSGQPQIAINDVSTAEGNTGTKTLRFTLALSSAAVSPVTLNYTTSDGSGTSPADYAAAQGALTFAPGTTVQTITINVVADNVQENDETFFITLSNVVGADLVDGVGQGDILNDDTATVNQVLYAIDSPFGSGFPVLYTIDPVTAVATMVGSTGVAPPNGYFSGMGADNLGNLFAHDDSSFYSINTTTGQATLLFNMGTAEIGEGDIAFDAASGMFFGTNFFQSDLVRVDPVMLTSTSLGVMTVNGTPASGGIDWDGVAFRGSTFYGYVGSRDGNTGLSDHLYTMDLATRAVTDVGDTGISVGGGGDLTYNSALDVFYHMHSSFGGQLYSLNPLTGVATLIGSSGLTNVLAIAMAGSAPPPVVVVPPPSVPTFTASNDTLFGDAGNDTLFGAGGNDLIVGGADNDLLEGTAGNDSILGGAGLDTLNGGLGDDTLNGQGGADLLDGGAGHDTSIWEGAVSGNDLLADAVGDNTLLVNGSGVADIFNVAKDANDLLTVSQLGKMVTVGPTFGSVIIDGGISGDTITVGDLTEVRGIVLEIRGGAGDDVLSAAGNPIGDIRLVMDGGDGNDTVLGGSGNETLRGGAGVDSLNGGAGNDTLEGGLGNDRLDGGDGNDMVNGDAGQDVLFGSAGTDLINGGDGDDTIDGGTENDTLNGNDGDDSLLGTSGNDSLLGSTGLDTLGGGDGNDTLDGGYNNDSLIGGIGDDKIRGDHGNDTITGDDGNDTINGGDGNDLILGGLNNDCLNGGSGDDIVNGGGGSDIVVGGDGKDTLRGGSGNDLVLGQDGDDNIDGQTGTDTIAGNQGADVINDAPTEINEAFVLSAALLNKLNAL